MTATQEPPSLSFPRDIFDKLSPRPYLLAHLSPSDPSTPPTRPSGRSITTPRPATLHTNSLTNTHGSAVVRIGDTSAVCGVRGELLDIANAAGFRSGDDSTSDAERALTCDEVQDLDLLVPNLELNTGCSPKHLPGQAPGSLAQSLSARLLSLLHSSRLVDPENLGIWYREPDAAAFELGDEEGGMEVEGKRKLVGFWTLYIDIVFISLDGNPFDIAWAAVLMALSSTKLPKAEWDEEEGMLLCSPEAEDQVPLKLNGFPVSSTFVGFEAVSKNEFDQDGQAKSKRWIMEDPDQFEEDVCEDTATVVVDCTGVKPGNEGPAKIVRFEKRGGVVIGAQDLIPLIERASHRWREWSSLLAGAK